MIKVAELDLVKFAQDVYALSAPQGLGFLHVKEGGLAEEDAKRCIGEATRPRQVVLDMDYVHGRACKMHVWHTENGYELPDSWYDHTESQYDELLSKHGIERETPAMEKCAPDPNIAIPSGCTLEPMIQMAAAMGGEHPCDRCNMDRKVCKGYARKDGRR